MAEKEMTNSDERIARAEQAMLGYFKEDEGADVEQYVSSLLADLMHYCKGTSIDFSQRLNLAEIHFGSEGGDPGPEVSDPGPKKNRFIVMHHHEYGTTIYHIEAFEEPSEEELVEFINSVEGPDQVELGNGEDLDVVCIDMDEPEWLDMPANATGEEN